MQGWLGRKQVREAAVVTLNKVVRFIDEARRGVDVIRWKRVGNALGDDATVVMCLGDNLGTG